MTGREQRKASCSRQTWHPERCHNQACNGVTLPLPGIVQLRQWLCHKVENWGTVVPFPRRTRNLSHFQIYLISKFISFPNLSHFQIYLISKFIPFPNLSHFQIYLISKFISFPNLSHFQIIQTGPGADLVTYWMNIEDSFHEDDVARAWSWHLTSIEC